MEVVIPPTGNDWTPELHPRDDEGKFTESGGGALDTVRDVFTSAEKTVSIGGGEVTATPVMDWRSNDVRQAAESELSERVDDPEYSMDYIEDKYDAWFSMDRDEMLNTSTSDLWVAAAKRTDNYTEPENSQFDLTSRTINDPQENDLETSFDVTRDVLSDIFGDTVPVSRGVSGEFAEQLLEAKENGEEIELDHRTLESWSTFPDHAQQFAEGEGAGAIITTEIPVDRVFGSSFTTPGLEEHENEIIAGLDKTVTYSPGQIHDTSDESMTQVYNKMREATASS